MINTAVSLVLQDFLSKYPEPEDAKKHVNEAAIAMQYLEDAVKKVRASREGKLIEKPVVPYYR